jgi:signal transduction histidine kinase
MRTQQILINLVGNAIKFSKPNDKIVVEIGKPEQIEGQKYNFEIKVRDQGMGMNE